MKVMHTNVTTLNTQQYNYSKCYGWEQQFYQLKKYSTVKSPSNWIARDQNLCWSQIPFQVKGKGKDLPRTGHEGSDGE